jgi:hypothetical protein
VTETADANDSVAPDIRSIMQLLEQRVARTRLPDSFGWARIGDQSLDDFVANYLADHLPDDSLNPFHFNPHLSEASSLLDGCLARRDQIFALEGSALTSALELALAESTHEADLALALIQLQAAGRQAAIPDLKPGESNLRSQFAARAESRMARLALHNQDGGPLNYAQRISRLRELFADDIRAVYQRLLAARKGLHGAHVVAGLPEIPTWKWDQTANLDNLVNWTRDTIRRIELASNEEVTRTYNFLLVRKGGLQIDVFKKGAIQNFELSKEDFKWFRNSEVRIMGFGVAMGCKIDVGHSAGERGEDHFRSRAANHTFSVLLVPPRQVIASTDELIWDPYAERQLYLVNQVPVWQNGPQLHSPPDASGVMTNIDPVGIWTAVVYDQMINPDGEQEPLDFSEIAVNGYRVRPVELIMSLTVVGKRVKKP